MYLTTCRAVLPVMQAQCRGAIVNISSTAALWSDDSDIAYDTSKAGVNRASRHWIYLSVRDDADNGSDAGMRRRRSTGER
jgi:NADP-dependent 3-hydroxy acid dehydrogenase YdfG